MAFLFIPFNSFAVDINSGASATCDSGVLNTDTGPVNLRAEYQAETINLKWYNGNNQITVPSASNSCTYDTPISLPANPTKPGYKFKGWKVFTGIPIEYIENDGTPWIDTGIPTNNNNYNIVLDFMILNYQFTDSHRGTAIVYGTNTVSGNNVWAILIYAGQKILLYTNTHTTYPRPQYRYSPDFRTNKRYLIDMNYNRTIVNGTQYNYDNLQLGTVNNGTITLLANTPNTYTARIYSFKIYDSGTLIRDMVPVKDLSGVACMYDKVSGQFFYNAGTGDFIAGPEIQNTSN